MKPPHLHLASPARRSVRASQFLSWKRGILRTRLSVFSLGLCLGMICTAQAEAAPASKSTRGPHARAGLTIEHHPSTGQVLVTWKGRGRLMARPGPASPWREIQGPPGHCLVTPEESQMTFQVAGGGGGFYSDNAVGYYNMEIPPGLSLVAYQFYNSAYTLSHLSPTAPDGAQFFKYTQGLGYVVSTFDATLGVWSNPDMELIPGEGYYLNNPTGDTVTQLFVGEVPQGELINPIPAGLSAKASIIPQGGTLSYPHAVPGEDGDEIRLYVNDGLGGGYFETSVFDGTLNAWQPDLNLNVGQGFWIQKATAQDWVRIFFVN